MLEEGKKEGRKVEVVMLLLEEGRMGAGEWCGGGGAAGGGKEGAGRKVEVVAAIIDVP